MLTARTPPAKKKKKKQKKMKKKKKKQTKQMKAKRQKQNKGNHDHGHDHDHGDDDNNHHDHDHQDDATQMGARTRPRRHHLSKNQKKQGDCFPLFDARANLRWVASQGLLQDRRLIVLLGTKVAATLGLRQCRRLFDYAWVVISPTTGLPESVTSATTVTTGVGVGAGGAGTAPVDTLFTRPRTLLAVLPHPSGVSHFWNTSANVRRAKKFASMCLERSGVVREALRVAPAPMHDDAQFLHQVGRTRMRRLHRISPHFATCQCTKRKRWCAKCCVGFQRTSKYFVVDDNVTGSQDDVGGEEAEDGDDPRTTTAPTHNNEGCGV